MYIYNSAQYEEYLNAQKEKKGIKRVGFVAGTCVLGYILIQNFLSTILFATPLRDVYLSETDLQSVFTVVFSVLGFIIPFGMGGIYLERINKTEIFNFGKPVSVPLMISSVFLGILVCNAGNYATSIFVSIVGAGGVNLTSPEYIIPESTGGRIMYAISIAVVPALVEEFAIRGVVLQPLRKYGDKFAILASSVVFAVLHGNLVQAPFALISGIGIGYAVCITNSIWTGVIIHFCNNFYAVLTEFMFADITVEAQLNAVYATVTLSICAISVVGSIFFVILKGKRKIMPSFISMSEGEKMGAFMGNVPMIIALIVLVFITMQYVSLAK